MTILAALLLLAPLAAGAEVGPAHAEAAAVRAWNALADKPGANAAAHVAELQQALRAAGLPQLATLALVQLSREASGENVRAAARRQLLTNADQGDAAAAAALLDLELPAGELAARPELAIRLAHDHLERALLDKPLQEGSSFEAGETMQPVLPEGPVRHAFADKPDARSARALAELAQAQKLASSVPADSGHSAAARELAGLAALAAGDELTAEKEFDSLAGMPDKASGGRSQRALLQLARLAYARGDDARAERLYSRVGRGANEWLEALFEASWSHFRRGEDERVLGNLLTLQAPFFQGRYFPEAFVLRALVLYENCRYADARRALKSLDVLFRPRHEVLSAALKVLDRLPPSSDALDVQHGQLAPALLQSAAAEIARSADADLLKTAAGPQDLQTLRKAVAAAAADAAKDISGVVAAPDLQAQRAALAAMTAELDSFDRRPALRGSSLAATVLPSLRSARQRLLTLPRAMLRARLLADRGELRELLGQSLRLSYEISGRERDQETDPSARATSRNAAPPELEDDEVLWPFQGEYWRDELGSYRFSLGARCTPAPRFKKPPAGSSTADLQR